MSNPAEAELLVQEDYQEKIAWAIHMGIMQYINSQQ
jgi:N-acetylmuramoyl-L-alanine amidase